jgi:hypothetical protein
MATTPKFTHWPAQHEALLTPDAIRQAYEKGWMGCLSPDPATVARVNRIIKDTSGYDSLQDAADQNGWAGSGAGKLSLPILITRKYWPNMWPGEAQQTGCCVSMATRNALAVTLACELFAGGIDPVSRKAEGIPVTTPDGEKAGAFSNAPNYWMRGYNGDGWSCPTSVEVAVNSIGLVVAKNYPELGFDLTHCNAHNDHLYGSSKPPANIMQVMGEHRVRSSARVESKELARDALANGYGITTCGGEAWSSTRNEDGVSKRSGSWSHALGMLACDDRKETIDKYGDTLFWIQNSWANWNSGPLTVRGTAIQMTPGGFWTTWAAVKNRDMNAFSNLVGWPPQKLIDYASADYLN